MNNDFGTEGVVMCLYVVEVILFILCALIQILTFAFVFTWVAHELFVKNDKT